MSRLAPRCRPRRRRGPCLLILALLLLLPPGVCRAGEGVPGLTGFQAHSFGARCLQLLEGGRYRELASLFHMDPGAGAAARAAEQAQLARLLEHLADRFGSPRGGQLVEIPVPVEQLTVEGLTSAYWRDRSRYAPVSYRVDFARQGTGFLALRIVLYANRLQLRSVAFGLPAACPDAAERIAAIAAALPSGADHPPADAENAHE